MDHPDEYRAELVKCYLALCFIIGLPLDQLHEMQSRADSFGCFLDPTAYLASADARQDDREVVDALRKAIATLRPTSIAKLRRGAAAVAPEVGG